MAFAGYVLGCRQCVSLKILRQQDSVWLGQLGVYDLNRSGGRQLERQGPLTGPGLITSERYVSVPETEQGKVATITARLRAPSYDCSSIAYFKMVRQSKEGLTALCFPGDYQLGLDVLVRVGGDEVGVESRANT